MTTLITGASSGIGEALALECSKEPDAVLFICGRDSQRLEDVAARCRALGATVYPRTVDVSDADAVRDWLKVCEKISPPGRVFSNAGVGTGEETEENVRKSFAINVGGNLNVVLPMIDYMRKRADGEKHIIITSSIAGYAPLKACPAYSAAKACLKTWGLALRARLKKEGIKVSVVAPGFVRSRITDRNTCPMPFFMEADKAAKIILRRVERNRALIAFPWPMRLAVWLYSLLPRW